MIRPGFGRTDMKEEIDPADGMMMQLNLTKAQIKNIMMQMRKVISLRGNFKVEFGDKKKMKLPPKIAQAVQKKYNSIRRPQINRNLQFKFLSLTKICLMH